MKRLFTLDMKNYDENAPRFKRPSVRAIITRNGTIAMVHSLKYDYLHSLKYDYYKFPGGGIENGESHHKALIREVREESGLCIIPETIREFGSVLRLQRGVYGDNEVFEQENLYYWCNVEEKTWSQDLDDYEAEERFTLEFVTPKEAIETNRNNNHGLKDPLMIERETRVLEILMKKLK